MSIKSMSALLVLTLLLVAVASIADVKAESLQPANPDIEFESLPYADADAYTEAAWLPPTTSDVCWMSSNSKGSSTVRLRFASAGGGYYRFAGTFTYTDGHLGAIFGSSITTSTAIYVTATSSVSDSSKIKMETAQATINRSTMKMTVYISGLKHIKSSANPYSVSASFDGPITYSKITCP